jgi:hypothetical protein
MVWGMGYGVWGMGYKVLGIGLKVRVRVRVRVWGLGYDNEGCRVTMLRIVGLGLGFRV